MRNSMGSRRHLARRPDSLRYTDTELVLKQAGYVVVQFPSCLNFVHCWSSGTTGQPMVLIGKRRREVKNGNKGETNCKTTGPGINLAL